MVFRGERPPERNEEGRSVGRGFWGFAAPAAKTGLAVMLHEARTDLAMWLACTFLFLVGAGAGSLDARLAAGRADPS